MLVVNGINMTRARELKAVPGSKWKDVAYSMMIPYSRLIVAVRTLERLEAGQPLTWHQQLVNSRRELDTKEMIARRKYIADHAKDWTGHERNGSRVLGPAKRESNNQPQWLCACFCGKQFKRTSVALAVPNRVLHCPRCMRLAMLARSSKRKVTANENV